MLKKYAKTLGGLTGYVVYEPEGYDKTKKYPVIFFFHGIGERGDGSDANLQNVYDFIASQWNNFMTGLSSNKWILIAPQLAPNSNWSINYVTEALKFALNYSIDDDRKILMDVSLGGQIGWLAPSVSTEFAAAVNICPVYVQVDFCKIKIPVWAFHAKGDPVVGYSGTKSAIDAINACNPPVKAKYTELSKTYHEIWGEVLSPILYPGESLTAWQWMEQQKRGTVPVPVPSPAPAPTPIPAPVTTLLKADASATLTSILGTTAILDGSKSTGYKDTGAWKYLLWQQLSGPNYDVFVNGKNDGVTVSLKNLRAGNKYKFRLTAGNDAATSTDDVELSVSQVPSGKQQVGTATITATGQSVPIWSDHTW